MPDQGGTGGISNGTVLVKDGIIVDVGTEEQVDIPGAASVINARGKWVLPGLIDPHVHIGLLEGGDVKDTNEMTHPVTPEVRVIDAVNPNHESFRHARSAGYTTVLCTPGSANVVGGQGAVMKTSGLSVTDMTVRHPAGMKMAFGGNPKRNFPGKAIDSYPRTRMGIAAVLRQALAHAEAYARNGSERRFFDPGLHALAAMLEGEFPARIHVGRSDDILTILRIADEFGFDFTLEHATEGHLLADELARRSIPCVIGPLFSARDASELRNLSFRTPGILAKAGVLVALTTDHPVSPIQYGMAQCALTVKAGMPPDEALRAITINGARIMGVADRIGSIQVGKEADITILDGHPFEMNSKVEQTLIQGKVVFEARC